MVRVFIRHQNQQILQIKVFAVRFFLSSGSRLPNIYYSPFELVQLRCI